MCFVVWSWNYTEYRYSKNCNQSTTVNVFDCVNDYNVLALQCLIFRFYLYQRRGVGSLWRLNQLSKLLPLVFKKPSWTHWKWSTSWKIGIWCGILRKKIVGPFFFEITINTASYQEIIQGFIVNLGAEDGVAWFQQESATAHTTAPIMDFLREFFERGIILKNLWPPCSIDLSPCDFFLRGTKFLPTILDLLKNWRSKSQRSFTTLMFRCREKYSRTYWSE